jgi:membrane peptidoglycan carboxypeptidase
MAMRLKPEQFWATLNRAGFGQTPGSGFPGEASGVLRDPKTWKPVEQATMAYGHGISVSLLQLARAYMAFANDGVVMPLTFLKRDVDDMNGERVLSVEIARTVRTMMETVTQEGGTAVLAQIPGYRVAGKTGTAHKVVDGKYSPDHYISSFVGMAPASDPRLIIAVMIDEPSGAAYYGGMVAAPVFAQVMAAALRQLGIAPDEPDSPPTRVTGRCLRNRIRLEHGICRTHPCPTGHNGSWPDGGQPEGRSRRGVRRLSGNPSGWPRLHFQRDRPQCGWNPVGKEGLCLGPCLVAAQCRCRRPEKPGG